MKNLILLILLAFMVTSCGGPNACECVEQYNYWNQDGGLYKINQDLINRCTNYYKDSDAYTYPADLNSARKNAKKECN